MARLQVKADAAVTAMLLLPHLATINVSAIHLFIAAYGCQSPPLPHLPIGH